MTDRKAFKTGREFAAWVGLVPRQNSTGGKERLGSISKQGDRYLRRLLIIGALSVIKSTRTRPDKYPWVGCSVMSPTGQLVAVALANKMARIAWAILAKAETYRAPARTCSGALVASAYVATPAPSVGAAEDVRMSTDHQQYSTENQAEAIRQYASRRGIEIVRTYADEGKSGLTIEGRPALQRLLRDVQSGVADFTAILVYDVSRWGRFPSRPQPDWSMINPGELQTLRAKQADTRAQLMKRDSDDRSHRYESRWLLPTGRWSFDEYWDPRATCTLCSLARARPPQF